MAWKHHSLEWTIGWNAFCRFPNFVRRLVGLSQAVFEFPRWYRWLWRARWPARFFELHGSAQDAPLKEGAEKFLIHPDLARNAKVEWPDVDLD
jgi:hypothetical protein